MSCRSSAAYIVVGHEGTAWKRTDWLLSAGCLKQLSEYNLKREYTEMSGPLLVRITTSVVKPGVNVQEHTDNRS